MTSKTFSYKTQIKLHHTDAAGLLFFAHQFAIIHEAYEALLERWGCSFAQMLRQRSYFLPIVHAESDYKAPLFVGDWIKIQVQVGAVGRTSFTFDYVLTKKGGKLIGTSRTVHVTIDKKSGKKIPLPASLRSSLRKFSGRGPAESNP